MDDTPEAVKALERTDANEIVDDFDFSYDGYQVVRGEFFAHIREPGITFCDCKVNLNTACLRRLPEVDYVQFLVNPQTLKLAVRPCKEDAKDSFLWCNNTNGKRKPRQITCRMFFAKIADLMGWNPHNSYKMLGKIINSGEEYLIIFDLTATEVYQRVQKDGQKPKMSRTPKFPADWQNQFGLPIEEHRKLLQVNIFEGYTVFGVGGKKKDIIAEATSSILPNDGLKINTASGGVYSE